MIDECVMPKKPRVVDHGMKTLEEMNKSRKLAVIFESETCKNEHAGNSFESRAAK
tara:strand:+ start:922 stop:1086 length:165 start_codon:yes stop_codon:yes gene_type:complete